MNERKRGIQNKPAKNKSMKTTKTILTVTAITALFASSVFAGPILSPRASGNRPSGIVSSGVKDPNLIAGPRLGKATPDVKRFTGAAVKDPNVLAETKCPMAPKAKGTAECKKMCETAGLK